MNDAGALSVIEVDGIVAATSPGQEADTRAALGSADAQIDSPAPRETSSATSEAEESDASAETPVTAAQTGTSPTKPGNPRKDATARMLEATREAAAAKARTAELEARLAALERRQPEPAAPTRQPEPPKVQGEKFPTYDAYLQTNPDASWDDWNDAKIDWTADRKVSAYQQSVQAEREQGHLRETWQGHTERLDRARTEKYPDFDQVVAQANAQYAALGVPQFPPVMLDAIIGSDQSDDLLYFLGTHPDEGVLLAGRFANRPVTDAELVRDILELKVAATAGVRTGSATARPSIRAAAPPNPVGSSAPAPSVNGLGSLDPDAHIAAYRKQQAERRRR